MVTGSTSTVMIEELRSRWRDLPFLKRINEYEVTEKLKFCSFIRLTTQYIVAKYVNCNSPKV